MSIERVRFGKIWALAWTLALAYTALRTRNSAEKITVEVRTCLAVIAFPVYCLTVAKTWFERTGYSNNIYTIVTIADRTRKWAARLRYATLAVAVLALLVFAILGIADENPGWTAVGIITPIALVLVAASAIFEVSRNPGAIKRQCKKGQALKRLDPRWLISDLAQRPRTFGGVAFARKTLRVLADPGDRVLTVARDSSLRGLYMQLKFEKTREDPDVLYGVV